MASDTLYSAVASVSKKSCATPAPHVKLTVLAHNLEGGRAPVDRNVRQLGHATLRGLARPQRVHVGRVGQRLRMRMRGGGHQEGVAGLGLVVALGGRGEQLLLQGQVELLGQDVGCGGGRDVGGGGGGRDGGGGRGQEGGEDAGDGLREGFWEG